MDLSRRWHLDSKRIVKFALVSLRGAGATKQSKNKDCFAKSACLPNRQARNDTQKFLITKALVIIFLFTSNLFADELIKVDAALKKIFPKAADFKKEVIQLSSEQIQHIEDAAGIAFEGKHSDQIILYIIKDQNNVLGYGFEDTVLGKWGPIHYLVTLNVDGKVREVVVLDYQEIRGKPIAKKRFLRQYQNKSIKDPVKLHRDIDGITGATISSTSITDGVRKILYLYKQQIENK